MAENEPKLCFCCGVKLTRKRYGSGRLEDATAFSKRKFCSLSCAGVRKEATKEKKAQREEKHEKKAESTATPCFGAEKKTAIEILEEAANNENLDWVSRINAAKALAPYQSKKIEGGKEGKKGEKDEAAKKASTGRFAPAAGPKIININQGKTST